MTGVKQVCSSNESHCPALDHNWFIGMQMFLGHILVSIGSNISLMISIPWGVYINLKKKVTMRGAILYTDMKPLG